MRDEGTEATSGRDTCCGCVGTSQRASRGERVFSSAGLGKVTSS